MSLQNLVVDLSLLNDTPEALEGEAIVPEGKYHALITSVEHAEMPSAHYKVRYQILAGTNKAAVGCNSVEKFFLSENAIKRLKVLAMRLGLIGENDFGGNKALNMAELIGREVIVEIAHDTYVSNKDGKERKRSQWAYAGFWSPADARVADVPRNTQAAAALAARVAEAFSSRVHGPGAEGEPASEDVF